MNPKDLTPELLERAAEGANFMQWFKKQIWSRKPDFAEDEDDLDQFAMDILRYLGK